jgi:hypothetical protein
MLAVKDKSCSNACRHISLCTSNGAIIIIITIIITVIIISESPTLLE